MSEENDTTSVALKPGTKEKLDDEGRDGESYDATINRIVENHRTFKKVKNTVLNHIS